MMWSVDLLPIQLEMAALGNTVALEWCVPHSSRRSAGNVSLENFAPSASSPWLRLFRNNIKDVHLEKD